MLAIVGSRINNEWAYFFRWLFPSEQQLMCAGTGAHVEFEIRCWVWKVVLEDMQQHEWWGLFRMGSDPSNQVRVELTRDEELPNFSALDRSTTLPSGEGNVNKSFFDSIQTWSTCTYTLYITALTAVCLTWCNCQLFCRPWGDYLATQLAEEDEFSRPTNSRRVRPLHY